MVRLRQFDVAWRRSRLERAVVLPGSSESACSNACDAAGCSPWRASRTPRSFQSSGRAAAMETMILCSRMASTRAPCAV